jgi:hypothetical protein
VGCTYVKFIHVGYGKYTLVWTFVNSLNICEKTTVSPRAEGTGYRVQGRGQRAEGTGYRVQGRGQRAEGRGYRVQGTGYRAEGGGDRVQGTGQRAGQQYGVSQMASR